MNTKWLIITIVLVIGGLLLIAGLQKPMGTQQKNQRIVLKTYKDPNNVYTIKIPSNWTKNESVATSTTGLKTDHPVKSEIQVSQFTKPAEMGITVQVIKGQPICPLSYKTSTKLAGLPAAYDPSIYTWTIPTTTATVMVSVAYPGTNSFHGPMQKVQPTPFPEAKIKADKKLVTARLASLKFNGLKPFSCE